MPKKQSAVTLEDLAGMVQRGFAANDERFSNLEQRFDGLEQRFDGLEKRFDGLEKRFDGLEERFDGLEQKLDSHIKDSRREHAQIYARLTDTVSRAEYLALLDRIEAQRA